MAISDRGKGVGVTQRAAEVTLSQWTKKVSELLKRQIVMLAKLEANGKISYGNSGGNFRWPVRYDAHVLKPFPDMGEVKFERKTTKTHAVMDWRSKQSGDAISLREKLENRGEAAVIKIFENREGVIRDGLVDDFAEQFWKDGDTAQAVAEEDFHGLESMMSVGTQVATDKLASVNNDNYATLSTAVGSLSPLPKWDRIWTPTIVNTAYNPGAGVQAFGDYADEYLRFAFLRMARGQGAGNRCDMAVLTKDAYNALLNLMDDKEQIVVARGQGAKLVSMGFQTIELDGVPITWDQSVPAVDARGHAVQGYLATTQRMELKLLNPSKLFEHKITWSSAYAADELFFYIIGNFKFESPVHFGKLVSITPG